MVVMGIPYSGATMHVLLDLMLAFADVETHRFSPTTVLPPLL